MADQDARALLLTIQANTELLRSNLSAAERAVEEFTRSTQEHLAAQDEKFELFGHSLERLEGPLERLKALGEVAVGALLGESLVETGKKALEFAGNVKFVSEQVGTGTDFLQKYRYAAGQFGVATATADEGLNKFARSIGEAANGNKGIIDIFDRLGVKVLDTNGKVRSVEAVFRDTANGIHSLESPAEKSADVLALMGKGASSLIPLLSQGADGFNTLAQAAQQLGVVLSPELIEHSEEVNHKLAALKQVVDAQMASAIAENAASIETLASALVKLAGGVTAFLSSHPGEALTILGGLAGARAGGPVGAVVGAAAGGLASAYLDVKQDDESNDLEYRRKKYLEARQRYHSSVDAGGLVAQNAIDSGVDLSTDRASALASYRLEIQRFTRALAASKQKEGERAGSDGAGSTNDNGDALRQVQSDLAKLEQQKKGASGAALAAYNEEIATKKRQIAFMKEGATAEMASSLAAKQGAAEKRGETEALKASRLAEEQRRQALQADEQYLQEELRLRRSILDGAKSSATNDVERDQLQRDIINAEADATKARIADQLQKTLGDPNTSPDRKRLAQTRADDLGRLNEQNRTQGLSNVDIARAVQTQKDMVDKASLDLQGQIALLGLDDRLAVARKERLRIELQLLDYQERQAKAAQQAIIDSNDPKVTPADKALAKERIGQIDAQHDRNVELVQRQNEGPLDQYRHQLASSVGDIGDQLQQLQVDAVQQLGDHFEQAAAKALHLHGVLGDIIGDLLQMAEKDLISSILGNGSGAGGAGLFGAGAAAGGGGLLSGLGSLLGNTFIPGFATGGAMMIGGAGGTDKNLLSLNGSPLAKVSRGETLAIIPRGRPASAIIPARVPDLGGMGIARPGGQQHVRVLVEANDYFDAKVHSIAAPLAGNAYQNATEDGANLARDRAAWAQGRQLGGR